MDLLIHSIFVIIGFFILIKGADLLVNGASSLAKKFHISDLIIGLTIVAMGTSMPELVVNLLSGDLKDSTSHANEVVFGNIIGSNIFNIYLVLGISSIIYPSKIEKSAFRNEIPYLLFITLIFFFIINDSFTGDSKSNELSFADSCILLLLFLVFMIYIIWQIKINSSKNAKFLSDIPPDRSGLKKSIMLVIIGMVGLIWGGDIIIENAVNIAKLFNVSDKLIGLTILAIGTSLPELAASATAAFQKKPDLAVGNIIGSNLFNTLLILGCTGFFHDPLIYNPSLNLDILVLLMGMFLILIFNYSQKKRYIDKSEGVVLLCIFVLYFYFLLGRENIFPLLF